MMRYVSPLRYPGGKAKLADFVKAILEQNRLLDGHYVEPYAGGASVALSLLVDEYVSRVHINDLDPAVHAFWHSVLHDTDALCRLIRDKRVSAAEWRRQRAVQETPTTADALALGFSTFFLNRTNRSGIIASGGMIGGNDQSGKWKLDARYNKVALIRRIERIARYRDRISLHCSDALELLKKLIPTLPPKSLLYLDPPYYVKGQRRLYANFYEHADHARVAALVTRAPLPWIVSYDDVPPIRKLYRGFRVIRYHLSYSARDRYDGAEAMFVSAGLRVPPATDLRSPAARSVA